MHFSKPTTNKPSSIAKLLTILSMAINHADSFLVSINNVGKIGDVGKTGNIREIDKRNAVNSVLAENKRLKELKKDTNIIPTVLIHCFTTAIVTLVFASIFSTGIFTCY